MYEDLIGIPFKDGGRSKKGFDCYGLVAEIYKRNNIILPEYYAPAFNSELINKQITEAKQLNIWERVTGKEIPKLAIIALKFNSNLCNHVGVYIGAGKFIHMRNKIGCNIDRVDSPAWKRCIEGYYIYKGG